MSAKRKCSGTSKRTGKPCGQTPPKGSRVCKWHGGKAPQVEKAAKVRAAREQAEAEAQRMAALDGVDLDPIEHLVDCLLRASQLAKVWTEMVGELDDLAAEENADSKTRGELEYERDTDPESKYELSVRSKDRLLGLDRYGQAGVHPFVKEMNDAIERRAKFAKMCLDAGVAERQVELYEQQVQIAHDAFEAGLAALDLDDAAKQKARKAYAARLRTS